MPWFAQPWALWGLLTLPALAALYFLRNRFRRLPVSSLLLWTRVARPREGGRRFERMTAPLSFFLEALALTLLTIAAADPRRPLPQARRPLIAVLDDSASMSARDPGDGATPRERAERALLAAATARDTASVRLIFAGLSPRVGEAVVGSAWRSALSEWTCRAPGDSVERALALAHEIGRGRARILVLTDRAPAAPPESAGVRWLAFGRSLPNAAIVAAARSAGGARDRVLVEVAGFAETAIETRLTLRGLTPTPETRAIRLDPAGPPYRLILEAPPDAGDIEIELAADALAADNRAVLLPSPRAPVRVRLDLRPPLRGLVERALAATGRAALVETPPIELALSDRGEDASEADWSVLFSGSGQGASSFVGPYVMQPRHPLLEGLALDGTVWGAGPLDGGRGAPILLVGDQPLIAVETRVDGGRVLRIAFDPALSDVHRTPNWPALFWNLLEWRASERPGPLEINGRAGGESLVRTPSPAAEAVVRSPDGREQRARARGGLLATTTDDAGVYEIRLESEAYRLARNFIAPEESDLRGAASGEWGRWTDADTLQRETVSLAWPFGLAALGVLALHAGLAARNKT